MRHKHHIIPKHMGGTDDPSNLIEVTIEQHAELHKQLYEQFGNWEDELAWKGLSKMIEKQEIISEVIRNTHKGKKTSEETKRKMSDASPWKGKKRDPKTIDKMRESNKNRKLSDKQIDLMREKFSGKGNPMFGKTHTEESRQKISDARKRQTGKKRGPYKGKTEYSNSHKKVMNSLNGQ